MTKILVPVVLPHMLTGVRLAVDTAWLVIGSVGIGFRVWDEWNNLSVAYIIIALIVIGVVSYLLEQALVMLFMAFSYPKVCN